MKLLDRLLRRPRALLVAMLLVSALCLPLLLRINLQGDLVDLLPRSSSAYIQATTNPSPPVPRVSGRVTRRKSRPMSLTVETRGSVGMSQRLGLR